tara:strand:- start:1 stop:537 length:537 start_codon:yes stop_codon:yes gene_type:complete
MSLPSLTKLSQQVHGPLSVDARGKGRGRAYTTTVVPEPFLNAFLEDKITSILYDRWRKYAYEILAQYENVSEGDWRAAGYDLNVEFPVLALLANEFGDEWEAYIQRRDDRDAEWVVSDTIEADDLDDMIKFELGHFLHLDTKKEIQEAIAKVQKIVRDKVAEDEDEDEDDDEEEDEDA